MGKFSLLAAALILANLPFMAIGKSAVKHTKPAAHRPDPALLEFLGTWESSDGQWVDPMTFARINPGKVLHNGKLPVGADGKPSGKTLLDGGNGA